MSTRHRQECNLQIKLPYLVHSLVDFPRLNIRFCLAAVVFVPHFLACDRSAALTVFGSGDAVQADTDAVEIEGAAVCKVPDIVVWLHKGFGGEAALGAVVVSRPWGNVPSRRADCHLPRPLPQSVGHRTKYCTPSAETALLNTRGGVPPHFTGQSGWG